MLRILFTSVAALAMSAAAAQAGGSGCRTCYQRVAHPAQYRTVAEPVLVRPAQTVAHATPAVYGTVHEKVVLRPAQTYARHIPAVSQTVAETVMVAPAGKKWVIRHDAHGREIGCWVKVPAQYATHHRTVVVHPGRTVHEVVPAEYGVRARHVVVQPASVRHEVIPAEYGVRHRHEMVAPASESWQPIGGHRRHKHY